MRRSLSLMLSFGALACSASIQSIHAQSSDPNASQTDVVLIKLAQPSYPRAARGARIQGDVEITVGLQRDGSIESAVVARGHPILAMAALQSAEKSEYECRRCSETMTSYSLVYTFRLEVPALGRSEAIPVTQLQNHIIVIDEPPTITVGNYDPLRIRSAKCLYLWKCGFR